MACREDLIQLLAGGIGGTAGAIITCPLEVVKTRLQSSNPGFFPPSSSNNAKQEPPAPKPAPTSQRTKMVVPDIALQNRSGTTIPVATVNSQRLPEASSKGFGGQHSVFRHRPAFPETWNTAFRFSTASSPHPAASPPVTNPNGPTNPRPSIGVIKCLRLIIQKEGLIGLFKGLGPNIVGVAPSRAIYFWAYTTAKKNFNKNLTSVSKDSPFVHVLSAAAAGFSSSTLTNPLWLIKTRLQLDRASGNNTLTVKKCVYNIYSRLGVFGFWKGVTASYWGISETIIHFVIYEFLKKEWAAYQNRRIDKEKTLFDFFGFMLCGACSKSCATCVAYPHEVARTRMREEGKKYKTFWSTLAIVYKEEGRVGLYRGLMTQLLRQIPNTAIMMSTYELVFYVLTKYNIEGSPPSQIFGKREPKKPKTTSETKPDTTGDGKDAVTPSSGGEEEREQSTPESIRNKSSHSQ